MTDRETLGYLQSLDPQELEALQTAALMGRSFFIDHLLFLCPIKPSKLLGLLEGLVKRKLIREKVNDPRGTYLFNSQKLASQILKSMDREKRRQCLLRMAEYLEQELPGNGNRSVLLAEIYLKLKGEKDGFVHLKKAADLLTTAHRTAEALSLYRTIIEGLLSIKRDSAEDALLMDSVIAYAPIAINRFSPQEILPLLESSMRIARILNNHSANSTIEICLGRLFQSQGKSNEASLHYEEGWRVAKEFGNEDLLRSVSKNYALSLFWQGRMREAIRTYEQTLGDLEEISPELRDLWAHLMLAYCYGITGRISRGVGLAEAVRERAINQKVLKAQSFAHATIAHILLGVRRIKEAEIHIDKAMEIGNRTGDDLALWMSKPCKSYELYSKGDLKGARDLLQSAFTHAERMGQTYSPSPLIMEVLYALDMAGDQLIPEHFFSSEIEKMMDWSNIYMKGAALRYLAMAQKTTILDLKVTEDLLEKSRLLLTEAGAKIERARTDIELCRLNIERQDYGRAKRFGNSAYNTLSEIDEHLFPSELLFLTEKRRREIRLIKGVSRLGTTLGSLSDHKDYLGKVITIMTEMFGAERGVIFLNQGECTASPLKTIAARNFSPEELRQFDQGPLHDLVCKAMEQKETLIISHQKDLLPGGASKEGFLQNSIACLPMRIGDKVNGLIYIDNRLIKGLFSKKDILVMASIATQVGLAIEAFSLYQQNENLKARIQEEFIYPERVEDNRANHLIVGESQAMKQVMAQVGKVAGTNAAVLIYGETGVGKELVARSIHQLSRRADRLFISVNISALPDGLIASELFGHEKGAFTGAVRSRPGRFELADGGTIFLDEIGDLSQDAQIKLLRVLQEGEFERVGGTMTLRSDFRLIAATNKDLAQEVDQGRFRQDLYYRLSSFPIKVPPLRERVEDIPDLAFCFISQQRAKNGKKVKKISKMEMRKLIEYPWPGNVRELEHVIERAVILSEHENLVIHDISPPFLSPGLGSAQDEGSLDEIQRKHILKTLNQVKWRIRGLGGAAEILGLKPSTLESRMKKLGILRK